MNHLNSYLMKRHLTDNPACSCGNPNETREHVLLHRPNYIYISYGINVYTLPDIHMNVDTLPSGSRRY